MSRTSPVYASAAVGVSGEEKAKIQFAPAIPGGGLRFGDIPLCQCNVARCYVFRIVAVALELYLHRSLLVLKENVCPRANVHIAERWSTTS